MSENIHGSQYDQVFILRCWDERRDQITNSRKWRMKVAHVNSHEEQHAGSMREVCEFIENRLAEFRSVSPPAAGQGE